MAVSNIFERQLGGNKQNLHHLHMHLVLSHTDAQIVVNCITQGSRKSKPSKLVKITNQVWGGERLFAGSQQLYQLRNWSRGVPLTPEPGEAKLFLLTFTSCCHRSTAGSWSSSLHSTLSPPETRPAAAANYHSIGDNGNVIKYHKRAGRPAMANRGLWEWRIPLFGNLLPTGGLSQVDRFNRLAVKCWLVHSDGTYQSRHVAREAPGRHSSDELNQIITFQALPDAQAHIYSQSAET